MAKRCIAVLASLLTLVQFSVCPSAQAQSTDGIATISYLLGAPWSCSPTKLGQINGRVSFDVAAQNTLHEHDVSRDEESDSYFGYSPTAHYYYMTTTDNGGFYGYLTSLDGVTFTGTIRAGGARVFKETLSFLKTSDTSIEIEQTLIDGEQVTKNKSFCRR